MDFQDRVLKCIDCGADFTFTAGEQRFFEGKGFTNQPRRCRACKAAKQDRPAGRTGQPHHVETSAVCAGCGRETTVPFKPTQGRAVLCRDCFQANKSSAAAGR
jgi:CxxC-x17-CxxC domain-containing protein